MKKVIHIFSIAVITVLCLVTGCKREDKYKSTVVTASTPVITLNGPADTTINRGATWSDPGATWTDSVTGEYNKVITVSVNTSVDSAYVLVYTAVNKNGFFATVYRGLGVTNMNGNIDVSGTYNGYINDVNGPIPFVDTVYKVSRALFAHSNVDGQNNTGLMVIKTDSTISVATIINADLTGALVPETFSQDTINYSFPVSFWFTPSVLNVPPGSPSGEGLPMGEQLVFQKQVYGPYVHHGGVVLPHH